MRSIRTVVVARSRSISIVVVARTSSASGRNSLDHFNRNDRIKRDIHGNNHLTSRQLLYTFQYQKSSNILPSIDRMQDAFIATNAIITSSAGTTALG